MKIIFKLIENFHNLIVDFLVNLNIIPVIKKMLTVDNEITNIITESKKRLDKLKILSNFFENVDVISILIKTEIIHNLFKDNDKLDFSKLDLFHVQFTDSLINLLDKVKKKKESDSLNIINEINFNNEYISKYNKTDKPKDDFDTERRLYSGHFTDFLKKVYIDLSESKKTVKWGEITQFNQKYSLDYYREDNITNFNPTNDISFYIHDNYKIEKKLLGKLNKQNFRVRFLCGYRVDVNEFELFKIFQTEEHFIFDVENKTLRLFDVPKSLNINTNTSNIESIVDELVDKNRTLNERLNLLKMSLSDDVKKVLKDYKTNIENIDITSKIFDFDEETNILRAMLNLNINN